LYQEQVGEDGRDEYEGAAVLENSRAFDVEALFVDL